MPEIIQFTPPALPDGSPLPKYVAWVLKKAENATNKPKSHGLLNLLSVEEKKELYSLWATHYLELGVLVHTKEGLQTQRKAVLQLPVKEGELFSTLFWEYPGGYDGINNRGCLFPSLTTEFKTGTLGEEQYIDRLSALLRTILNYVETSGWVKMTTRLTVSESKAFKFAAIGFAGGLIATIIPSLGILPGAIMFLSVPIIIVSFLVLIYLTSYILWRDVNAFCPTKEGRMLLSLWRQYEKVAEAVSRGASYNIAPEATGRKRKIFS